MGFWGTTEQETGVSAACWVANILPSAINRRILPNGRLHVRKSHLQNTKLLRQLLQSRVSKLLSYILLCLNRVFCSYTLQHPLWPSRSKWRIFYGKEERRRHPEMIIRLRCEATRHYALYHRVLPAWDSHLSLC